jgi:hypothetical protein
MSDVARYSAAGEGVVKTDPAGLLVKWNDYARLKAEVERLTAMADENAHLHKGIYSLSLNVVQLKDEVERLTSGIKPEGHNDLAGRAVEHCLELKAEVERLRKAGDELAEAGSLAGCSECFGLYERLEDALKAWTAAKEGKQP